MWRTCSFFGVLLLAATAHAATLISMASGNIDSSSTWSVVDPTSFQNVNTTTTALTTSYAGSYSTQPGAITVQGIGVKLASLAGTIGTMSCDLYNVTGSSEVDAVTINLSDLPNIVGTTDDEGGWIVFKFGSTHILAASTNYELRCETSSGASAVSLYSSSGTAWSQMLVTTTAAAPATSGTVLFVGGNHTGQGTSNSYTVSVETTSNTDIYGTNSNSTTATPAISIFQGGTVAYDSTAATNYNMEFAGALVIYSGGTLNEGTSGTPIPMSSSCTNSAPCATLTMDTVTEGDTGITVHGGTFNTYGSPRNAAICSSGMACVQTHLFQNVSAGSISSLSVTDSTGWQNGDVVALADTDANSGTSETEKLTLTGNATSSTLPIATTLANAHLGQLITYTSTNTGYPYSFPEEAEIVLLTRNVRVIGSGNTTPGYIYCGPTANCSMSWTEFQWISGVNSGQYGIDSDTEAGGTFVMQYDSVHDAHDAAIVLGDTSTAWGGVSGSPATIQYVTVYNGPETNGGFPKNNAITMNQFTSNINWMLDNVTVLTIPSSANGAGGIYLRAVGGQFTNIVCGDEAAGGACLNVNYNNVGNVIPFFGNWGPLTFHSDSGFDVSWNPNGVSGTINGIYVYHGYGWFWGSSNNHMTVNPFYGLGNSVFAAGTKGNIDQILMNGFLANDSVSGARPPFGIDENFNNIEADNMELCPTQTVSITQASGTTNGNSLFHSCAGSGSATSITPVNDVGLTNALPTVIKFYGRNTSLLAAPDATNPGLLGQNFMSADSFVCADWIGTHECLLTFGIDTYDTAITIGGSASERVTPQIVRTTGYISGSTLTTTTATYPNLAMSPNILLSASSILPNTYVVNTGTGQGNAGTYVINNPQTLGSSGSPITITGQLGRLPSAPLYQGFKIAVPSGQTRHVCVSMRESSSSDTNGINYTGDAPRLIDRMNPTMNVMSDTVAATFTSGLYGQVQQECVTTPTAPQDGVFEYIVDADMTPTSNAGGWINVGGWMATN